jgi:hypothetical protein
MSRPEALLAWLLALLLFKGMATSAEAQEVPAPTPSPIALGGEIGNGTPGEVLAVTQRLMVQMGTFSIRPAHFQAAGNHQLLTRWSASMANMFRSALIYASRFTRRSNAGLVDAEAVLANALRVAQNSVDVAPNPALQTPLLRRIISRGIQIHAALAQARGGEVAPESRYQFLRTFIEMMIRMERIERAGLSEYVWHVGTCEARGVELSNCEPLLPPGISPAARTEALAQARRREEAARGARIQIVQTQIDYLLGPVMFASGTSVPAVDYRVVLRSMEYLARGIAQDLQWAPQGLQCRTLLLETLSDELSHFLEGSVFAEQLTVPEALQQARRTLEEARLNLCER